MFWNDPNLYSVAFKDIPNFPVPFYGTFPRHYTPFDVRQNLFTPPIVPNLFTPPIAPTYFTPPITPFMHTPQIPQYMNPMINPLLSGYDYRLPFFQGYRPFGL
jgi:hypothetical protein